MYPEAPVRALSLDIFCATLLAVRSRFDERRTCPPRQPTKTNDAAVEISTNRSQVYHKLQVSAEATVECDRSHGKSARYCPFERQVENRSVGRNLDETRARSTMATTARVVSNLDSWQIDKAIDFGPNPVKNNAHGTLIGFRQKGTASMVQLPPCRVSYGPGPYDTMVLLLDDETYNKLNEFNARVLDTVVRQCAWGALGRYATDEQIREAYVPLLREGTIALKAKALQVFGPEGRLAKEDVRSGDVIIAIVSPGWLFVKDDKITICMLAQQAYIVSKASQLESECLIVHP